MWHSITDQRNWDAALAAFEWPHALQAWAWGEFKSRWGWSAQRWALDGGAGAGRPRAMAQVLRRRLGRLPVCVLYVPKGPALAADAGAYRDTLAWLESRARSQHAVWVKIDGDLLADGFPAGDARAMLQARGWRYSPNQIQFRNTVHTRLDCGDDELLARMKPKWRYNIRLAEKRGVTVRPGLPSDYPLLYNMYAETGRRDGFIIREEPYYADAWQAMGGMPFIAWHEGAPLAALVLFTFRQRAWYFYGMSRSEGREHMPNHLLQWTAMRWARDHGFTVYDWWGAPEKLDETDPMWGVYRFKEGFGVQFVEGLGAWDYAPSRGVYRLYLRWYGAAFAH